MRPIIGILIVLTLLLIAAYVVYAYVLTSPTPSSAGATYVAAAPPSSAAPSSSSGGAVVSAPGAAAKLAAGCWKVTDGRPHVYRMSADGKLCHVPNPDAYAKMCGPWGSHKMTAPDTVPAVGDPIDTCT